jgi:hypothetical protein
MTYSDVLNLIKTALSLRPAGTKVQVEDHESAEIAILDYVEQVKTESTGSIVREAHSAATAEVNCNLTWNEAFADSDYSYVVNGFDSLGNPVEIMLVSRSSTKIVVKTLVDATLYAIARPYGGIGA